MNIMKRIITFKRLIRSLQIFAGITMTYLVISLTLVLWPSSEPFQEAAAMEGEPETRKLIESGDISNDYESEEFAIGARDGEDLFARRYGSGDTTTIIFLCMA